MVRTGIALVAVSILTTLPANARAQPKTSASVVKITATADKPSANGKQTVTITIAIDKSYHIYANPVGQEDLANAKTVVDIAGENKPQSVKVAYPDGKVVVDMVVGNYMIYEGKVEIKAEVVRAKGNTGPLKATVQVQAKRTDGKGGCLTPAIVEVEVK